MNIVNLTPHDITICDVNGVETVYPKSSSPARVEQTKRTVSIIGHIPIVEMEYGDIVGLPQEDSSTIYITSLLVAQAANKIGRRDVYAVADTYRDDQGRIVGAKALTNSFGAYDSFRRKVRDIADSMQDRGNYVGDFDLTAFACDLYTALG